MRDLSLLAVGAAAGFAACLALHRLRSSKVFLLVEFDVQDVVKWRNAILPHAAASKDEAGNRRFALHRPCAANSLSCPDVDKYVLIEEFESQAALDLHNGSPHMAKYGPILGAAANVSITKLVPL